MQSTRLAQTAFAKIRGDQATHGGFAGPAHPASWFATPKMCTVKPAQQVAMLTLTSALSAVVWGATALCPPGVRPPEVERSSWSRGRASPVSDPALTVPSLHKSVLLPNQHETFGLDAGRMWHEWHDCLGMLWSRTQPNISSSRCAGILMDIADAGKTLVHAALLRQAESSPKASAPGLTMRVTSTDRHCIMSLALWTCAQGRT